MTTIGAQQATIHHIEWPGCASEPPAAVFGSGPSGVGLDDGLAPWSCMAGTSICVRDI